MALKVEKKLIVLLSTNNRLLYPDTGLLTSELYHLGSASQQIMHDLEWWGRPTGLPSL